MATPTDNQQEARQRRQARKEAGPRIVELSEKLVRGVITDEERNQLEQLRQQYPQQVDANIRTYERFKAAGNR